MCFTFYASQHTAVSTHKDIMLGNWGPWGKGTAVYPHWQAKQEHTPFKPRAHSARASLLCFTINININKQHLAIYDFTKTSIQYSEAIKQPAVGYSCTSRVVL